MTRTTPLALLLTLLVASSAAAQATSFSRITWTTRGPGLYGSGSTLVVEASGAAHLETASAPPGAVRLGAPQNVLRGRLQASELRTLDAALRSPGLAQVPRQLPMGFNGVRLDFEFVLTGGRPSVRAEGFSGRFGDHDALLLPVQVVLDGIYDRLQAASTEILLEIDRVPLPELIRADEDVELIVSGPGLPGVEFAALRAVLSGRTLTIQALGRQVALAPARRFTERLKVERAGRVGVGYLHVKAVTQGYGSERVLIVQSEAARAGRFTGRIDTKKGEVSLVIQVDRKRTQRLRLDAAASATLGRFAHEYVQFDGQLDAEGRLGVRRLLQPERRRIEGRVLHYGSIRAEGLGHVSTFGPAGEFLQRIGTETPVVVEGWFFAEGGWTPARRWYEGGGRSLYRAQRLYAERVRAKVSQAVKLKRGWRTSSELQPGEEVWIGKRRLFGWAAEVETLDGAKSGRARFKERFVFAQPVKLASEGSGSGIAGSLGGVSGP